MNFSSLLLAVGALALTSSCASTMAWEKYPNQTKPDLQCRTGTDVGYNLFIWNCQDGKKTVVRQKVGELIGALPAERQEIACGETSDLEWILNPTSGEGPCRPGHVLWKTDRK